MTRMPDIFREAEEAIFGRHQTQTAPPATEPEPVTTTQEAPAMSKLTDAKNVIEDVAIRVRELAANPLIDAIAEAGLGMVLTPAEISVITGMISAFERDRANTPQPQPVAVQ